MTKILKQVLLFIESFTLNEIRELEKNSFRTAAFKDDTNMFSTEFSEGFGFGLDYDYTIKLLLTNQLCPYGKIFVPQLFVRSVLQNFGRNIFPYGPHSWSKRAQ